MQVKAAIADGERRLAQKREEADRRDQERLRRQRETIAEFWAPVIEQIKAVTPAWSHEFLSWPVDEKPERWEEHETRFLPATISIPDVATVFAFVRGAKVEFRPARYFLSDNDDEWEVARLGNSPLTSYDFGATDRSDYFTMTLALAAEEEKRVPELQAEADRRNAERERLKLGVVPFDMQELADDPHEMVESWMDRAFGNARRTDDFGTSAIAYALIGILELLRSRA